MAMITVSVTDAETAKQPLEPPSILVIAVANQYSLATAIGWASALAKSPNNAPIQVGAPPSKPVTGAPDGPPLDAVNGPAGEYPGMGIYRIDQGFQLDLGAAAPGQAGWWIILMPPTGDYERLDPATGEWGPAAAFVTEDEAIDFWSFPKDATPLTLYVLRKRIEYKPQRKLLLEQWGGVMQPALANALHHYVQNNNWPSGDDPNEGMRLLAGWWINDLSWAIMDEGIPARDYDALVRNYALMQSVIQEIPWPEPEIPYFHRCGVGMPITQGRNGEPMSLTNHRLYSPTWSAYFPRAYEKIRTDIALIFLANLQVIFECVIKKVADAVEKAEESKKAWKLVSIVVPVLILPSPVMMLGAIWETVEVAFLGNVDPDTLALIDVAVGVVIGLASGGVTLTGLDLLTSKAFEEMAKQIAAMVEAQGLKATKELISDLAGLKDLPPVLIPFMLWCLRVSMLDLLFSALAKEATGVDVDPQADITGPMVQTAQQAGVAIPANVQALVDGDDPFAPAQIPTIFKPILAASFGIAVIGVALYLAEVI